jgi:hypothetical protein
MAHGPHDGRSKYFAHRRCVYLRSGGLRHRPNRLSPDTMTDLASTIASAFVAHDPLEPWLTESHWDEHYWDNEARLVAEQLTAGMDVQATRSLILDVLEQTLGFVVGPLQLRSDRVDALAAACWQATQPPSDDEAAGAPFGV